MFFSHTRFVAMLFVILSLLGALVLPVAASAQDNSETAHLCQQGGWATHARAETPSVAFTSQGECVTYGAQGGQLVPLMLTENPNCELAYIPNTILTGIDFSGCDLSGISLNHIDLSSTNLSGADLSGASLIGASFYFANLTGTDFSGANLTSAYFTQANAIDANFSGANLTRATLSGANLTGADLTNTDLSYAIMTGTNLTGAGLTGANLTNTYWSNTTCPDGSNSDVNGGTCEGHL